MKEPPVTLEWVDTLLRWASVALLLFVLIWLLSSIALWFHRRRYNLTVAEAIQPETGPPDFLSASTQRREQILSQGTTFDLQRKSSVGERLTSPPKPGSERFARAARIVSLVLALISVLTSIVGAMASIELFDNIGQQLTNWQRFTEIVKSHWLGSTLVVLVIVVELHRFVMAVK